MTTPGKALRNKIHSAAPVLAPGVFDGLSARLVEAAGFQAIYASGGAIARSAGFPDLGILSFDEIAYRLAPILEVTELPVIADADTGFGGTLNVRRSFQALERLGIAAAHLEDQVFPKRCGHLNNKQLVSIEEMCDKIKAAKDTLQDPDFILIARTDAIAVEGLEQALERAQAYAAAGADMLFIEAPENVAHIEKIAHDLPGPKLINMFAGGKTPLTPVDTLKKLGYSLIIIPSDLQRAAIYAMQKTLAVIKRDGDSREYQDQMCSFKEREEIVRTEDYLKK
jgi:2-methylisocitrate lyase-like PEP mutase family enzyme